MEANPPIAEADRVGGELLIAGHIVRESTLDFERAVGQGQPGTQRICRTNVETGLAERPAIESSQSRRIAKACVDRDVPQPAVAPGFDDHLRLNPGVADAFASIVDRQIEPALEDSSSEAEVLVGIIVGEYLDFGEARDPAREQQTVKPRPVAEFETVRRDPKRLEELPGERITAELRPAPGVGGLWGAVHGAAVIDRSGRDGSGRPSRPRSTPAHSGWMSIRGAAKGSGERIKKSNFLS